MPMETERAHAPPRTSVPVTHMRAARSDSAAPSVPVPQQQHTASTAKTPQAAPRSQHCRDATSNTTQPAQQARSGAGRRQNAQADAAAGGRAFACVRMLRVRLTSVCRFVLPTSGCASASWAVDMAAGPGLSATAAVSQWSGDASQSGTDRCRQPERCACVRLTQKRARVQRSQQNRVLMSVTRACECAQDTDDRFTNSARAAAARRQAGRSGSHISARTWHQQDGGL